MTGSRRLAAAVLPPFMLLSAACADGPVVQPQVDEPGRLPLLSEIRCTARPGLREVSCEGKDLATNRTGARTTQLIVGGQHRFVRLTSSDISVAGSVMSFDATVQNLLQQPLATSDGANPHAAGVRVFFASLAGNGGSGDVTVANATGTATFTSSAQPYFQYGGSAGSELGADGLLSSGETSAAKRWQIEFGTHTTISFTVFVAAEKPAADAAYLRFTQVSTGGGHSCGITSEGAYCWGYGGNGELGNGGTASSSVPVPVTQTASGTFTQISAGTSHTCGITSSGAYCWGNDSNGKLGNGGAGSSSLPEAVIQTSSGIFTKVAAWGAHTCGITSNGAYCWGFGAYGQLGNGGNDDSSVPVPVTQTSSGTFSEVSPGQLHTCGITSSGAWCWGNNDRGQLGDSIPDPWTNVPVAVRQTTSGTFTQVSAAQQLNCGITSSGAWCWGKGSLGDGATTESAVPVPVTQSSSGVFTQVSAGGYHTCGMTSSGAYCWGQGTEGQMGNGDTMNSGVPVPVTQTGSGVFTAVSASAAPSHSCGITGSGTYCWGTGLNGRLGTGRTLQESSPVPVAGSLGP